MRFGRFEALGFVNSKMEPKNTAKPPIRGKLIFNTQQLLHECWVSKLSGFPRPGEALDIPPPRSHPLGGDLQALRTLPHFPPEAQAQAWIRRIFSRQSCLGTDLWSLM